MTRHAAEQKLLVSANVSNLKVYTAWSESAFIRCHYHTGYYLPVVVQEKYTITLFMFIQCALHDSKLVSLAKLRVSHVFLQKSKKCHYHHCHYRHTLFCGNSCCGQLIGLYPLINKVNMCVFTGMIVKTLLVILLCIKIRFLIRWW